MTIPRTVAGYLILLLGCAGAPMLPFFLLPAVPAGAILFGVHAPVLVVTILLDEFLVPSGLPFWLSLTFFTLCFLPTYLLLRYLTKL
ncbi:MAG: hypothetical protein OYG31_01405 [Candidatus Kaiserbacteria bacterium]|nr:hypothetical protein [Candidatus Kaiserbacteria bacterium]